MAKVLEALEQDDFRPAGSNVIRLENFVQIPAPDMPLRQVGMKKYQEWCRMLLDSGALNVMTQGHVEAYAASCDEMATAMSKGKPASRHTVEQQGKALRILQKLIDNGTVAAPGRKAQGSYDTFGFAKRARQRRHGSD